MDRPLTDHKAISDHDLLVKLDQKFSDFQMQYRIDINELKDGTKSSIADHEKRINVLEEKMGQDNTYVRLMIALGVIVVGLLIWHLTGYGI